MASAVFERPEFVEPAVVGVAAGQVGPTHRDRARQCDAREALRVGIADVRAGGHDLPFGLVNVGTLGQHLRGDCRHCKGHDAWRLAPGRSQSFAQLWFGNRRQRDQRFDIELALRPLLPCAC